MAEPKAYKRKTSGRRGEDLEQSYSKSTVLWLKIATFLMAVTALIGGWNIQFMSTISGDIKGITKVMTDDRIKVNKIELQTRLALDNSNKNLEKIQKVADKLNSHILIDANRR